MPPSEPTPDSQDALSEVIRSGSAVDPVEMRMAMQRVRAALHAPTAEAPLKIGRHFVLERVAAGGFGVVYRAYDPVLSRKLALKVLRTGTGPLSEATRKALVREAQTIARVAHPNVVTVFDVGTHDDGVAEHVYIAMELVEGRSLTRWLRDEKRSWKEVLRVFVQAGHGLAAAHRAGVVHRDFKPDNVLVGDDGRVRVADFGVAHPETDAATPNTEPADGDTEAGPDAGPSSGTPAYMAPEQLEGRRADARSDIYSFCVALYEGIFGDPPFSRTLDSDAALEAKQQRELQLTSPRPEVPTWLRQAILRGLSPDPKSRWASMPRLLAALERRQWRRRLRIAAIASIAAFASVLAYSTRPTPVPCDDADAPVRIAWNEAQTTRIQAAFAALESPFANDAWSRAAPVLDRYASELSAAHREFCKARPFLAETEPSAVAKQESCLRRRVASFAALTHRLESPDESAAQRIVMAAHRLPPANRCGARPGLENGPSAEETEAARQVLAEALAELQIGDPKRGREILDAVATNASQWPPALRAEYELQRGNAFLEDGKAQEAADAMLTAVRLAEAAGAHLLTAHIKNRLVFVYGTRLLQTDVAEVWALNAKSAMARIDPSPRELAGYHAHVGALHMAKGDYDAAEEEFNRSLEMRAAVLGPDALELATNWNNLGAIASLRSQPERELERYGRARDIYVRHLGPKHPRVAMINGNLAETYQRLDQPDRAKALLLEALAIYRETLGDDNPSAAVIHRHLAGLYSDQGDRDASLREATRAREVLETVYGPDHPETAYAVAFLGIHHHRSGELAEAQKYYEDALQRFEAAAPKHPRSTTTLNNLGEVELELGRPNAALARYRAALEIAETALGPGHPRTASCLTGIGRALTALDQHAEAVPHLERALKIRTELGAGKRLEAETAFALARAVAHTDRPRARELSDFALTRAREAGRGQDVEEIAAWQKKHDR